MIAAKDEAKERLSVALFNIFSDEIIPAEILLDKKYKNIRFVNGDGTLKGNIVTISEVKGYGTVSFEVWWFL